MLKCSLLFQNAVNATKNAAVCLLVICFYRVFIVHAIHPSLFSPRLPNQSYCTGRRGRWHEYGEEGDTEDVEFKKECARVYVSVSDSLELAVNLTLLKS